MVAKIVEKRHTLEENDTPTKRRRNLNNADTVTIAHFVDKKEDLCCYDKV